MRVNPAYVVRNVFGKTILIPFLRTKIGNQPIYLNDTGSNVIKMLAQSKDEQELCNNVANYYSLHENTDEYKSIQNFVQNLIELEIIG